MSDLRIQCPECGLEPRPIGSAVFADWWESHHINCNGRTLDRITVANLQAMRDRGVR